MRKQNLFSTNSDTQKSTYITPNQKIVELDMDCMLLQDSDQENTVGGEDTEEEETETDVKAFKFELW